MKTGLIISVLVSLMVCQSVIASELVPSKSPIASYADVDQATIKDFEFSVKNERIYFHWTVSENQAADKFELQSSVDGVSFNSMALVFGTDLSENNNYKISVKKNSQPRTYRIRIIQKDGSEQLHPLSLTVK
ncbi:MAG: hypothetical protein EOO05_16120 [Chitinophagaceae bacterium]|nr:MAG: hypothetical protein EOO05_16120 [Chitinophagaceae bacterium]